MQIRKGKVYIVGAGPGDWKLISVKGLEAIKNAEVIVYDFLSSKALLRFARSKTEIICAGKSDGLHIMEQGSINRLIYNKARHGRIVVRLKGGDPFLFSRGIEEALYLKRKGIDFEIIPGVTSAFAAPESFGIPLSRKGKYSSVAVLAGRKSNKADLDAPLCDTLVYLMGVANIKNIVKAVLKSGRDKLTPCAFIEKATTNDERIITGNLSNIIDKAYEYSVKPPAVLVIGQVVKYGKRLIPKKYRN
ncbi:MAG: uroporphyrinogen-III C-methyltransferase [Candidatus Omnitrophota bacterium]|jgi:uroporphyrin-III C-methyltransferase|nr:MAG: uroporphyrinogen-III C-methyltransferase [Candidatus Omnitrophota bacterium]